MLGGRLGEKVGISEEVIKKAASLAVRSHKESSVFIKEPAGSSADEVILAFGGSFSVEDFYGNDSFGETKIDVGLFPSIRSIGNDELGMVNAAFLKRFQAIHHTPSFQAEVKKAVEDQKLIVFSGHSSGGPVAILATIWYLEKYIRSDSKGIPPRCVTFGSPLIGNHIFPHALNRQNWSRYFLHFVGKYDIVPRITLAPLSSIKQEFSQILHFFNPKSPHFQQQSIARSHEAVKLFTGVLKNASSVTSHAACNLMGSTNSLLETISGFVKLSPYRPCGTYIFCTGNGKLVVVENPNAVLQMLFYCTQPSSEAEVPEKAYQSLFMRYENELDESLLGMQNVAYLDDKTEVPLSSNGIAFGETVNINTALNDLGLSTRARLCLQATQEFEKQRMANQKKIDDYETKINNKLRLISDYQKACKDRKVGCYDAFKIQKGDDDFKSNVSRLELAGMWDEVIEMLKRYELPDGFEGREEWVLLGTKFRRLVEPLDIANYYRHAKNEDTGTYLRDGGRPKRYKYTQRWLEHDKMLKKDSCSESIFWAKVEEMKRKSFHEIKNEVVEHEKQIQSWIEKQELDTDVFLEKSTFAEWWKALPEKHRAGSCLAKYFG